MSTTQFSPPIAPNPALLVHSPAPETSNSLLSSILPTITTPSTTSPTVSPKWYQNHHAEIHDLLAGAVGGVSGLVVGAPFDLVKVRLQSGLAGAATPLAAASHIFRTEGPRAFFKGLGPPIIANVPINAISFAAYANAQRNLNSWLDGSGGRSKIPTTPMQQQMDFYSNEFLSQYTLPEHFKSTFEPKLAQLRAQLQQQNPDANPTQFQNDFTTTTSLATNSSAPNWTAVFLAGCCSGLLQCVVLTPSEFLKIQAQNCIGKAPPPHRIAQNLIAQHGILSLYRGLFATILRETPSIGVYFLAYELAKWYLRSENWTPQVVVQGKVVSPQESHQLFKSHQPLNHILNIKGFQTDPVVASQPEVKINWQHNIEHNFWMTLLAGAIAGPISWTSTYPLDVVKTRLQSMPYEEYKKTSMWECTRQIYLEKGARSFTKGLGTTIARAIPVSAATFLFYEKTLDLCKKNELFMPSGGL